MSEPHSSPPSPLMPPMLDVPPNAPVTWLHKSRDWVRTWWYIIHFGAVMLVLALSPSSYRRSIRAQFAEHIYSNTWQVLPWFTVLCALISLVVTRIVVVTAQSYGLSNYALEMVVRVLVLELIPLSAALFVVLNMGFFKSLTINRFDDPTEFLPQVIGSMFSVLTLAAVSSTLTLILSYLVVYGFSPWGFGEYTRMVGRVFDPMVVLIFSIKSVLFSLAVAMIPLASSLQTDVSDTPMPHGTVRLFLVLVLIEAGTLAIKYI